MATFNLSRANALEFLQRDFQHILQRLDAEVPTQGENSVAQWHDRLLKATIRALQNLDKGTGRPPDLAHYDPMRQPDFEGTSTPAERAAMSLEGIDALDKLHRQNVALAIEQAANPVPTPITAEREAKAEAALARRMGIR